MARADPSARRFRRQLCRKQESQLCRALPGAGHRCRHARNRARSVDGADRRCTDEAPRRTQGVRDAAKRLRQGARDHAVHGRGALCRAHSGLCRRRQHRPRRLRCGAGAGWPGLFGWSGVAGPLRRVHRPRSGALLAAWARPMKPEIAPDRPVTGGLAHELEDSGNGKDPKIGKTEAKVGKTKIKTRRPAMRARKPKDALTAALSRTSVTPATRTRHTVEDQALDLALIGNCRVAALINPAGRIVWWCFPRFDSNPVFSRLL